MAVANVDTAVALFQSGGGKVLVQPRDLPLARAAVVADPQGAPLGLAQLRRDIPGATQPTASHFFWQEYLARDAGQALAFYKRVAGYNPAISDSRLGVEYHVLKKARGGAGLFQLPATVIGRPAELVAVRAGQRRRVAGRACDCAGRSGHRPRGAGASKRLAHRRRRSRRRGARAAKVPVLRRVIMNSAKRVSRILILAVVDCRGARGIELRGWCAELVSVRATRRDTEAEPAAARRSLSAARLSDLGGPGFGLRSTAP